MIIEGSLLVSSSVGFLEADDVGLLGEGGEVSKYFIMSRMPLGVAWVVRDGVHVVEDHPRMWDGGVEGAGSPVDRVRTH